MKLNFCGGRLSRKLATRLYLPPDEEFQADEIYVCSGADFETLYPSVYSAMPVTKCKLQMMRMTTQPNNERIGPALCGAIIGTLQIVCSC